MYCRVAINVRLLLMFSALVLVIMPLQVWAQDISIQHVSSYYVNEGESVTGVTIVGNLAYVSCDFGGLKILNIADPANPSFVGSYYAPGFVRNIFIRGSYAYVTAGDFGLQIVDISNPTAPSLVGSYAATVGGTALTVVVSGDYAYLADGYNGLLIINVSDPANPTLAGVYNMFSYLMGVALSGDYAYVTANFLEPDYGQLQAIDITDPANPTFFNSATYGGGAYGVSILGNYAFMGAYTSGMGIFDISTPGNPILAGSYDTPGSLKRIFTVDNWALLADGLSGFRMLDIGDPINPVPIDSVNTPGNTSEAVLSGSYIYVADDYSLEIYRIDGGPPPLVGAISGTIADSSTGIYMMGARVRVLQGATIVDSTVTDESGGYFFSNLGVGLYDIEASKEGYVTKTVQNIQVNANETAVVDVSLAPYTGPLPCSYIPGNVNGRAGFTGLDVVYAVAYLKGGPPPLFSCECTTGHTWYVEGDVNGSCTFTGLDVTYMVAFLKGGPALVPCPDCPPAR